MTTAPTAYYNGWGNPEPEAALVFGPNINDWPEQPELTENLLVKMASDITDPVTTTDELIPSGETSSFRSNPLKLARVHPLPQGSGLCGRAKAAQALEAARPAGDSLALEEGVYAALGRPLRSGAGYGHWLRHLCA